MKIGFDLDKVFVEHPPLIPDLMIEKLYKKKANGELLYRIPTKAEQFIRQASHYPLFRPPIKENLEFLKKLAKKNHHLYLISGRFGFLEQQTHELVKRYELDKIFEGMYFNFNNQQPHHFKNDLLSKLHLDIYVDDDIHLLKYVATQNKKTTFYWLHPNHSKQLILPNLISISHLSDIVK